MQQGLLTSLTQQPKTVVVVGSANSIAVVKLDSLRVHSVAGYFTFHRRLQDTAKGVSVDRYFGGDNPLWIDELGDCSINVNY